MYHWAKYSNLVSGDVVFTLIEGGKKENWKALYTVRQTITEPKLSKLNQFKNASTHLSLMLFFHNNLLQCSVLLISLLFFTSATFYYLLKLGLKTTDYHWRNWNKSAKSSLPHEKYHLQSLPLFWVTKWDLVWESTKKARKVDSTWYFGN